MPISTLTGYLHASPLQLSFINIYFSIPFEIVHAVAVVAVAVAESQYYYGQCETKETFSRFGVSHKNAAVKMLSIN